jgi:prepilin-type N-terminal cleavage/methylation domain-containing protein
MIMPIRFRRLRATRRRRGFSLTEVMMAMTLLAVVLMSMARMSMVVSKRGRVNTIAAKRTFTIIEEANKFGAMPYATLLAFSTSNVVDTAGDFIYTRRLTRTVVGDRITLKLAIVPSADATMVDSVWIYRSKPAISPLCTTC